MDSYRLTVKRTRNKGDEYPLFRIEFECVDTQLDKVVTFYTEMFSTRDIVEIAERCDMGWWETVKRYYVSGLSIEGENC